MCAFLITVALVLTACRKQDPVGELEKAAAAMGNAPATPSPTEAAADSTAIAGPPPAQQVKQAIDDYKAGKMEDAVTRLQLLRNMPALSPEQRMALQDSLAAVMTELYSLAEKGDARAIAAIASYEKMQTGRR